MQLPKVLITTTALSMITSCVGQSIQNGLTNLALGKKQARWTLVEKQEQRKLGKQIIKKLKAAAKKNKKEFIIPPGDYRFPANGTWSLIRLQGVKNIEIKAEGVTFWMEVWERGLVMTKCDNVSIKGLTIDYDPLPYSQGTIVATHIDKKLSRSYLEYKVDSGFLDPIELFDKSRGKASSSPILIFDRQGENIKYNQWERHPKIEKVSEDVFRVFTVPEAMPHPNPKVFTNYSDYSIKIGDKFIIMHRTWKPAVLVSSSKNIRFENVTLFASSGGGFIETGHYDWKGANVYRNCKNIRRPDTKRLIGTVADGFHSARCAIGPIIEGCEINYIGDDFVNIRGVLSVVISKPSPKTLNICMCREHEGKSVLNPGVSFEIIDHESGKVKAKAKIVSVKKERNLKILKESEKIKKQMGVIHMDCKAVYQIEVDMPLPEINGTDYVVYKDCIGAGFIIKNNKFSYNSARGMRIQSSNGIIKANKISSTRYAPLTFSMQMNWLEGTYCRNIEVSDNTFINCQTNLTEKIALKRLKASGKSSIAFPEIFIRSETKRGCTKPMASSHHSGIVFRNNKFINIKGAVFDIKNASDIKIEKNQIKTANNFSPALNSHINWGKNGVVLGAGTDAASIIVKNNLFEPKYKQINKNKDQK